ncbi:MAG TPA: MFS transporter [Sporichthya sp.]|nr:MFS transporter [Sporichthya sp.]
MSGALEAQAQQGLPLRSVRGRLVLAATVGASAMAGLDATVVNVALPHIGGDLGAGVSSLQWVLTGYLLALASLILLGGALGDRYGRRRVFMVGTVWFAAASVLCGLAPNIEVLVLARILQGVGGALLTPGSLAILQASFREADRAVAVGWWSGFGGAVFSVGPFLGGGLVDGPGWRWAFLLNVPVCILVLAFSRAVPETRAEQRGPRFDLGGVVLGVAALAALTWALTEGGPRGWDDPAVLVGAGIAAVAGAALVRHLMRTADPLVPPSLFADRTFTVVNLMTVLLYGAIGVSFFLVSYELQVAADWSALAAGSALVPASVLMLVLSARSGALAQRIGPRPQLVAGPALAGAGLLLLTRIDESTSWPGDVLPGSVLLGLGLAGFVAPLTATVMAAADPDHVSVASGVNNAIARAASLTALAVVPAASGLATAADPAGVTHAVRVGLVVAALLMVSAVPVAWGLGRRARTTPPAARWHCAIDAPPADGDPARCPRQPHR